MKKAVCLFLALMTLLTLQSDALSGSDEILEEAIKEEPAHYDLTNNQGYQASAERRGTAMFYLAIERRLTVMWQPKRDYLSMSGSFSNPAMPTRLHRSPQFQRSCASNRCIGILTKSKPQLWGKLGSTEQLKLETMVKGCLVATATTSSDHGTFLTGLDGKGNFEKNLESELSRRIYGRARLPQRSFSEPIKQFKYWELLIAKPIYRKPEIWVCLR